MPTLIGRIWRVDATPAGQGRTTYCISARDAQTGIVVQVHTLNPFQASVCHEAKGPVLIEWTANGAFKNVTHVSVVKEPSHAEP